MSRETWGNQASFLLACIGSAVGLGNIWRFPYLCYKSGGGAFLVPYVIMLLLCGLPLLFMELTAGQYTRQGPIGALGKMCPILQGAGVATVVISFWLCTYYNVIISWAMFYFVNSFKSPLPWSGCHNDWNTKACWDISDNDTIANESQNISSTQEFYDHRVLQMSSGIEDFGSIQWELLGFLFLAWVVVYFCIWKSVKTTGKVVFFTATFPYVLLMAFLIRGCTLPGAMDGIRFFIEPQWDKMLESSVWIYAAAQVFNSIGIAFGCLVAFSSYNPFHGPILRDTLIVVTIDAITCIICGICVFSTMGNLALEQNKAVDDVISDGPGLVFVVFPHALAKMPFPQVWSATFFSMLILLGIDSQFATVEVIITSLKDGCGDWISKHMRHEILVLLVCSLGFLFGIPYVFNGGIYLFQIVDYYAAAMTLMYIAFFECAAIVWIYGTKRLSANIKDMTGQYPNFMYRFCWKFISPFLIFGIWIFSIVDYKEPTYNKNTYTYPAWAITLGWCISATSLMPIPILAIVKIVKANADTLWKKIGVTLTTTITECPCGCETDLDENHEAHRHSTVSLIKGCDQIEESNAKKRRQSPLEFNGDITKC